MAATKTDVIPRKDGDDMQSQYIAIDLKSFYASVECVERGLDPLDTNLVVADLSRTEKTICLAVSPSLKQYGIPGRARLFEVVQRVREINAIRRSKAPNGKLVGGSQFDYFIRKCPDLAVDYIVAKPQMARYMQVSAQIYQIYLDYVAPEDIHVYSIDEVFMDVTGYLKSYNMTARELADVIIRDVLSQTGITATAGIGTNLYLSKIAMDIVAKHIKADKDGVRIAELDEQSYRQKLWGHKPITDFWRIGRGYSKKLAQYGMFTMGDVARCSVYQEDLLYKLFGKNAELLIDHAWGYEPCTIAEIKAYRPENTSLSVGQVLSQAYDFKKARLVIQEMAESLTLDLVRKKLVTNQMVLTVGYDRKSIETGYSGKITSDAYGRQIPAHAHGTQNLNRYTSSSKAIVGAVLELFDRIADPSLYVRRMYVVANHTEYEDKIACQCEQLSLFSAEEAEDEGALKKEREIQQTVLKLQERYGKNAVLKGMNFKQGATAVERNGQIGGHRA